MMIIVPCSVQLKSIWRSKYNVTDMSTCRGIKNEIIPFREVLNEHIVIYTLFLAKCFNALKLEKTRASRTTGAKGNNLFTSNSKFQITSII